MLMFLQSLEDIHVLAAAHLLDRPIVVFADRYIMHITQ